MRDEASAGTRKHFNAEEELARLSLVKKLLFLFRDHVSIGERQPEGFSRPVTFYLYRCEKCGPIVTYPQGHEGRIRCSDCWLEEIRGIHIEAGCQALQNLQKR